MSTMDREIAFEALSTLLQTPLTLATFGGFKGKSTKLDLTNFVHTTLCKLAAEKSHGNFLRSFISEMSVDVDEFFDPRFDYDFTDLQDDSMCMRGNEPYKRPCGWYRIALKVQNKYPDGNNWLGTDGWRSHSVAGEWPVSYHGTSVEGAAGIIKKNFKAGNKKDRQWYGRGIYSTYDLEQALCYCREFTSKKNGKTYRVIMQNRVNPKMRKECDRKDYWLIEIPEGTSPEEETELVEKSIRPYGILIKEVQVKNPYQPKEDQLAVNHKSVALAVCDFYCDVFSSLLGHNFV